MSACALCGSPAAAPFRAPQPETAPDLDGRPGEPARSTLARWVQSCRVCGACAPDLAALPAGGVPDRALRSRFQRWAALVAGTAMEAEALLQAAWEAEDAGRDAAPLRLRALAAWQATTETDQVLRQVDVARRAGAFGDALARLDALPAVMDAIPVQIAAFQRVRIAAADSGRYLLSSAVRPPSRTPHVTHGRLPAAKPGFWSRLFRA